MTTEQARAAVAALPSDTELGRNAAKRFWASCLWAELHLTGYDFAELFGQVWEESYLETIDALRKIDPDKADRDETAAREKIRRDRLAEEEKRRRKEEARARAAAGKKTPLRLLTLPEMAGILRARNRQRIGRLNH